MLSNTFFNRNKLLVAKYMTSFYDDNYYVAVVIINYSCNLQMHAHIELNTFW